MIVSERSSDGMLLLRCIVSVFLNSVAALMKRSKTRFIDTPPNKIAITLTEASRTACGLLSVLE